MQILRKDQENKKAGNKETKQIYCMEIFRIIIIVQITQYVFLSPEAFIKH